MPFVQKFQDLPWSLCLHLLIGGLGAWAGEGEGGLEFFFCLMTHSFGCHRKFEKGINFKKCLSPFLKFSLNNF